MTNINLTYVSRILGILILLLSASMLGSLGWSVYEFTYSQSPWRAGPEVIRAFVLSISASIAVGGLLFLIGIHSTRHLGKREALLIVSLAWFLGAAIAGLPFWFWARHHEFLPGQDLGFLSFVNCYFEAMSGLTTTGASILTNIESIPHGILMWRAFTHWLGGLGIVVLFVAVLPSLGGGTKRLFTCESTGISNEGITPHMQETARVIWIIYVFFTLLQIGLMKLVGGADLLWFTAITHTFATLATGGYSTFNASAGALTPGVQWVLIFFMILAGVNFGLYRQLVMGRFRRVWQDNELRFYLTIMFVGFVVIALCIANTSYRNPMGEMLTPRWTGVITDALFQAASIQTTTGFVSVNYDDWGLIAQSTLIILMFVGGCGGSTGGGIKVIRILGAIKILWVELERAFRPNVLRPVRIGMNSIEQSQRSSLLAYILGIIILFGIGSLLLMVTEASHGIDGPTALTASIASLNNIGPGLAKVGAVSNYNWFSDMGKVILCVLMAIGRLEVFAVLVVFSPHFWRSH